MLAVLTGTRPGIIKFAPIVRALERRHVPFLLIHSGQHYSPEMDAVFFQELELPAPTYKLDVVRHFPLQGEQTAEMLRGIERILIDTHPELLLVGGDCNTHLAGALAARKLHVPIGHVEAGMRSGDWRMSEEHNRVIIDHISEYLFVHGPAATANLEREHVSGAIHEVGTTIVDAVEQNLPLARRRSAIQAHLGLESRAYLLATTHRAENVDDPATLQAILQGLAEAARRTELPIIFPIHPRTRRRLQELAVDLDAAAWQRIRCLPPLGYFDFLALLANAAVLLTDSGGAQQEAAILRVPCVTLREVTEWQETLRLGANIAAGTSPERIAEAVVRMLEVPRTWPDPFGPAGAGAAIADIALQAIAAPAGVLA